MDKETYSLGVKCRNCGYYDFETIPVGTLVSSLVCPNCKCKELQRESLNGN